MRVSVYTPPGAGIHADKKLIRKQADIHKGNIAFSSLHVTVFERWPTATCVHRRRARRRLQEHKLDYIAGKRAKKMILTRSMSSPQPFPLTNRHGAAYLRAGPETDRARQPDR